jgi:hypothetical protein
MLYHFVSFRQGPPPTVLSVRLDFCGSGEPWKQTERVGCMVCRILSLMA